MNASLFTRRQLLFALQAGAVCAGLGGAAALLFSPKGKRDALVGSLEREMAEGDRSAAFVLAMMYAKGDRVPQDEAKALALLEKLAAAGDAAGAARLAIWRADGRACRVDMEAAEVLAKRGAEGGEGEGMRHLAMCHLKGRGVPKDDAKALAFARGAAEAGDALAMMFLAGRSAKNDPATAYLWYRMAEELAPQEAERAAGARGAAAMGPRLSAEEKGGAEAQAGAMQRKIKAQWAKTAWESARGGFPAR